MADPKYAGLSGIAVGEPDVYETSDLPEDDQHKTLDDLESESIEKLDVSVGGAFKNFKGKSIADREVDFSDSITKSRRLGYFTDRTEYELVGGEHREKETPHQKYQRLQHEIRELIEEVGKVQGSVKGDASGDNSNPILMAKQVEYLRQQVSDVHLENIIGTQAVIDSSDPQGALQRRLLTQIEAFNHSVSSSEKSAKPVPASGDHLTYELCYKPEQAKFSQMAKLADVEERLDRVSAVVGSDLEKFTGLCMDTSGKSLVEVAALLNAKLSLLEPAQLDHTEGRLHALNQKLNQIAEKKSVIQEADSLNKVSELYELMKKWEHTTASLPEIVDRMIALKELHEQALQFSQALSHLDAAQQQLTSNMQTNESLLKQAEATVTQNLAAIRANCESLDSRLKVLNK